MMMKWTKTVNGLKLPGQVTGCVFRETKRVLAEDSVDLVQVLIQSPTTFFLTIFGQRSLADRQFMESGQNSWADCQAVRRVVESFWQSIWYERSNGLECWESDLCRICVELFKS